MVERLIALDERLFMAVNGWGSPGLDACLGAATWLGNGVVLAALVLGGMAILDRRRLRAHAAAMVLSVAVGALPVEAVKSAVDRDRPARHFAARIEAGEVEVRMPSGPLYDRSFPSGHTQAAFGTAAYLSLVYPVLSPLLLGLAASVGLSRIYLGVHFPLDVAAGAAIGIVFSALGFAIRRVVSSSTVPDRDCRSGTMKRS
ncbi:MAG: phosphatase PAP2 family protein [Myxococcota bacterium]|nr:phosphatase PAP2 family protein [Myxococcota bacterium]